MPKASVTRQIAREKQKLIDFVLDIEKYPEFIPFCIDSKVYEKEDKQDEIVIIADLTIGRKPFVDTYKSDVRYDKKNDSIHVTNIGGPLNHLENKEQTSLWLKKYKYMKNKWHVGILLGVVGYFVGMYFISQRVDQDYFDYFNLNPYPEGVPADMIQNA